MKKNIALLTLFLGISLSAHSLSPDAIYKKIASKVVRVEALDANGQLSFGSGVIVAPMTVATNCHITGSRSTIRIKFKDKFFLTTVVHANVEKDLCILHAQQIQEPGVVLSSSKTLKVGQKVYALGNPEGLNLSLSDGLISALRTSQDGLLIQTTAAISPGSSGGGLFDVDGRLIGITSFKIRGGENLNFAIPADLIPNLEKSSRASSSAELASENTKLSWGEQINDAGNDNEKILEICRLWSKAEPQNVDSFLCIGKMGYISLWKPVPQVEKIAALRMAFKLRPQDSEIAILLSTALIEDKSKVMEAVQLLTKFLKETPRLSPERMGTLYLALAKAQIESANYGAAINALNNAVNSTPDLFEAWNLMSLTYCNNLQNYPAARSASMKAIKLQPKNPDVWQGLAIIYNNEKDYENAETAILQAIQFGQVFNKSIKNDLISRLSKKKISEYLKNLASIQFSQEKYDAVIETGKRGIAELRIEESSDFEPIVTLYTVIGLSQMTLKKASDAMESYRELASRCDSYFQNKSTNSFSKMFSEFSDINVENFIEDRCKKALFHLAVNARSVNDTQEFTRAKMRIKITAPELLELLEN